MTSKETENQQSHLIGVNVTTKDEVPDPHIPYWTERMHEKGFTNMQVTSFGKHIELTINSDSREEAIEVARSASEQLLANPIHQQFEIEGDYKEERGTSA